MSLKIDTKQPIYHSNISIDEIATPKANLFDVKWINAQVLDKLYGRIEFASTLLSGLRLHTAMSRASSTSSLTIRESIDQPMIFRE